VNVITRVPTGYKKLLPHRRLFWQGLVSLSAFVLPVVAVLLTLTVPDGPWPLVVAMWGLASILFAIASWAFFVVGVWVGEDGIAERGFFGRLNYFRRDEIARIMLARTFHSNGAATLPQLFLVDGDDNMLVRLRGQFWSFENMQVVSDTLDLPMQELSATEIREIHEEYPNLVYWFERRPWLAAALVTAVIAAVGTIILAVLVLSGAIVSVV
jgi:hypothetical protein